MRLLTLISLCKCRLKQGCWPDVFKLEIVTPVPKVPQPKTIDELRNISGLLNLNKISEKIVSKISNISNAPKMVI